MRPDFVPRSPFLRVRPPPRRGRADARRGDQPHLRALPPGALLALSVHLGGRRAPRRTGRRPGGSSINSGEARDFLLGGCARQMACTTCHDPHAEDRRDKLDALQTPAGNHVCTTCHARYAAPEALRAHAHHDPAGAGGACVACHMPRKNMGLGYALTRYHRIGSPTDAARVEQDRPLECALCHADRSVAAWSATWSACGASTTIARRWRALRRRSRRERAARHRRARQAARAGAGDGGAGRAAVRAALAPIARQLVNPIPLVRYYARRAVDAIRGAPCAVDLDARRAEIEAAARRCVPAAWPAPAAPRAAPARSRVDEPDDD